MLKKIIAALIVVFAFSCGKKSTPSNCGGPGCEGTHIYNITANYSNYVITKDTTYMFVSSTNDTMKLTREKTYTKVYSTTQACACTGESTNINSETLYGVYLFKNKNLAIEYSMATTYPSNKTFFEIIIGDTITVNDHVNASGEFDSSYLINDINVKKNDLDSINVGGKNYYAIFTSFDISTFYPQVTQIFYAKGFGIIRFTYNNLVYNII